VTPKRKKSFDPKTFLAQVGDGHSIGKYGKGQVVFSQGDTGDAVFYILVCTPFDRTGSWLR
jgi:CRP/FNR family cyclic AMP-dependent transcriptional regulator